MIAAISEPSQETLDKFFNGFRAQQVPYCDRFFIGGTPLDHQVPAVVTWPPSPEPGIVILRGFILAAGIPLPFDFHSVQSPKS